MFSYRCRILNYISINVFILTSRIATISNNRQDTSIVTQSTANLTGLQQGGCIKIPYCWS